MTDSRSQPPTRGIRAAALAMVTLLVPLRVFAAPPPPSAGTADRDRTVETTFESVDATIAGQWDFPARTPAPLVLLIPSQGRLDREGRPPGLGEEPGHGMYGELTDALVKAGFAVFRFDKPGVGRSAPGRYATERSNAIEAYGRAIDHARVDRDHVFLLGHSLGSDTIAGIYSRYEAVTPPRGVIFFDSTVGERMSVDVKAPLLIVNPNKDPDDRYTFGEFVVEARSVAPGGKLETSLVLIDDAEPGLLAPTVQGEEKLELHPRAIAATVEWLRKRHAGSPATDGARRDEPRTGAPCAASGRRRPADATARFDDTPLLASGEPASFE
jgi:pimeloyl-ACP methyl ester carboxylesterase